MLLHFNSFHIHSTVGKGTIISEGAKIKLFGVGIENVQFSPSVEIISSGTDFIEVNLTEGTFNFN